MGSEDGKRGAGIVATVLAVLALAVVAVTLWRHPPSLRGAIASVLALGVLYAAQRTLFPLSNLAQSKSIRFVVVFDVILFLVTGLFVSVMSCDRWANAILVAGCALLVGGFFGLLFGYPQGAAQSISKIVKLDAQGKPVLDAQGKPMVEAAAPGQVLPSRGQNLLAESAATLGKVITGFTLAKISGFGAHFATLCRTVAPALGAGDSSSVVAGILMTYFFATGFFAGLLLPVYFMSEIF